MKTLSELLHESPRTVSLVRAIGPRQPWSLVRALPASRSLRPRERTDAAPPPPRPSPSERR